MTRVRVSSRSAPRDGQAKTIHPSGSASRSHCPAPGGRHCSADHDRGEGPLHRAGAVEPKSRSCAPLGAEFRIPEYHAPCFRAAFHGRVSRVSRACPWAPCVRAAGGVCLAAWASSPLRDVLPGILSMNTLSHRRALLGRASLSLALLGLCAAAGWTQSPGEIVAEQKLSDTAGGFTGDLGPFDIFGTSITSLGDLNGDGVTDLAVGASHNGDGQVGHAVPVQ